MKNSQSSLSMASSGVSELIQKLEADGVAAGKLKAQSIVSDAQVEAEKILCDAKARARSMISEAEKESSKLLNVGKEQLSIAVRDAILQFKQVLIELVEDRLKKKVVGHFSDPEQLRSIILAVVSAAVKENNINGSSSIAISLSDHGDLNTDVFSTEEFDHFVSTEVASCFFGGVRLDNHRQAYSGVSIALEKNDVQLELNENTIAEMLTEQFCPHFRAILDGVKK